MAHDTPTRRDRLEHRELTPHADRARPRPYLVDPRRAHCPDNHRLTDVELTLEDTVVRCKYKFPAPGGRGYSGECGRLMLLVAGFHARDGSSRILIAPVTIHDVRHMQERRMSIDDELEYIGLGPPARP